MFASTRRARSQRPIARWAPRPVRRKPGSSDGVSEDFERVGADLDQLVTALLGKRLDTSPWLLARSHRSTRDDARHIHEGQISGDCAEGRWGLFGEHAPPFRAVQTGSSKLAGHTRAAALRL